MSTIELYKFCPNCKTTLEQKDIDNQPRKTCNSCGFIFWNNPNPSATVLLHKNGKVLMLQRSGEPFKNYWVLPGGYLESSEDPHETAIRETEEETGIKVEKLEGIIGVYRTPEEPRGVDIDIIYSAATVEDPILSSEHIAWKYFDPNDLPELIAYRHRNAILDWLKKK